MFPRLPFGIVTYAFTLFWTTFVETAVYIYFFLLLFCNVCGETNKQTNKRFGAVTHVKWNQFQTSYNSCDKETTARHVHFRACYSRQQYYCNLHLKKLRDKLQEKLPSVVAPLTKQCLRLLGMFLSLYILSSCVVLSLIL